MAIEHILPRLLIAMAVILGASRLMGMLFVRFRQPQVVGEMVAGIMLGPSLLGWLSEEAVRSGLWSFHVGHALFPTSIIPFLGILSQLGVILFLFLVGLELDPKLLRNKGHAAVVISHASIVVPFLLGTSLTLFLYPLLFNHTEAMRFTPVALFMGAAMSITAFPVLARILTERKMHKTRVGAVAITCAAVDDVTAWCMLAFVVGVARAEGLMPALVTAGLATVYVLGMFYIVRPFLRRLQAVHDRQGKLSGGAVALVLGLVLISAWMTEKIGIHALFGAFMVGAIMPKGTQFVHTLTEKLEDFIVVLLLPIFFAYTGLKTQIGLLNTVELWGYTGLIILVACLGKFGGSALAGRLCGFSWREAGAVGILMNTRGLMELVILNIGRELGVITPAVFAMMVLMALATTAMTSPVLHYIYPRRLYEDELQELAAKGKKSSVPAVLIPVADPRSGGPLLQLADWFTAAVAAPADPAPDAVERRDRLGLPHVGDRKIFALHLRRPVELDGYRGAFKEAGPGAPLAPKAQSEASLQPLLEFADRHGIPVESIAFVSRDVADDIARTAAERGADLVLMGSHRALVDRTVLGGTVHRVLTQTPTDVAILLDRGFRNISRVMVPYLRGPHDRLALELASRLGRAAGCSVTVLHVVPPDDATRAKESESAAAGAAEAMRRVFGDSHASTAVEFRVIRDADPIAAVVAESTHFDLLIVGVGEEWGLESQRFGLRPERLAAEARCSMLLVKKASPVTLRPETRVPDVAAPANAS
ncbi:cation:proton antiporter domain-containing protein [Humisphaera borealis]|uniref:Cation:proton antiporter n=1 Tax=Humisphaera borealis TaxID=2807512 RepID=A0A7M2WYC6_9BACT|nr:cation:proton antiporter [Humisphaera borealis]QOV89530.1 cation:proton antiporter [Humisphaera borealis]